MAAQDPRLGGVLRFCDLQAEYADLKGEMQVAMNKVLDSAMFIMGPEIGQLEAELSKYTGAKHSISCSSGTHAIEILLRAMDIGPGHEVITVPFTWISTAEVIPLVGAKIAFVDVEPNSFNIDATKLAAAIKPGVTKAIIAVSLFGQMPNIDAIRTVADPLGIPVIEDAAQSFGATRDGATSCGPVCFAATTSFFPAKPLGCYGDGGAIFTDNEALAAKIKAIRVHGGLVRDYHTVVGTNGRLDTLQAAVLLVKMNHLNDSLAKRVQAADWYNQFLGGADCVLPTVEAGNTHVYAQYTLRVKNRDKFVAHLKSKSIPYGIYYPRPLHIQECFADLGHKLGDFPVSEQLGDEVVSLPMHPYLTEHNCRMVADAVKEAIAVANAV